MPEIPFAIQWSIPESRLTPLKDSTFDEYLFSNTVSNMSGLEYYIGVFPNGNKEEYRGQTRISLFLEFYNVKKVVAKWNVSIESANYSSWCDNIFDSNGGWGYFICDTKDFFNPEKKFIVDGKCTVKVNGTFKFETANLSISDIGKQQKWNGGELGDEFWAKDESKDFTIIVDGKEIKVHKMVLDVRSNVFSSMLKTRMKESIENKVTITDFTFNVVEAGIKMIYDCNFTSTLSIEDQISLIQFFDKYDLPTLKEKIEPLLIKQISASTVCRLTNCSIITNSSTLKAKCIEFLTNAFFQTKTPLADIETLDKDIGMKILQNSLYKNVGTCYILSYFIVKVY